MNAKQKAVVAAAKANGVKRSPLKAVRTDFTEALRQISTLADALAKKGAGRNVPPNTIYAASEIYKLVPYLRQLQNMAQNLHHGSVLKGTVQAGIEDMHRRVILAADSVNGKTSPMARRDPDAADIAWHLGHVREQAKTLITFLHQPRRDELNYLHSKY